MTTSLALALALAATLAAALLWQIRRAAGLTAERDASRASERRFRTLTEFTADMIVESNVDMVRLYVSPRSRDLLGFSPEELVGQTAMTVVHPDDVAGYRAALSGLLDGSRERIVTTQRYRRRGGGFVWTEANVQLTRDDRGNPSGYIGSLRDIEARHAAEAALRASETFLRGVIDSSPDCIEVLDLEGRVTFISRNGLWMTPDGLRHTILGSDFLGLWPPGVRAEAAGALAAAAAGAQSRFAGRLGEAGAARHFDVLVSPIFDPAGQPERLLVIARDTTATVAANAALLESRSRYQLLAENSSDVVLLRTPGPEGATLFASPSCRLVLGYEPEAVVATADPCAAIHPDDRDRVRGLLAALGASAGSVRDTHRIRRADGSYIWVETAFKLAERAGEPVVVAAIRDVSERQRRAEDLAVAKDMAERARKVAEDANLAKSDFLAVISHEIRTPMNSIIGFTDLMLDSVDLPSANRRQAELIRAASSALLTMLNDILDFSKIEAGAVELEAIPFDPAALARDSAAMLEGFAATKALDLVVEAAEVPGTLIGDEARLRQILLNLLNNAVKFTTRGRVTLRIASEGRGSEAERLRFEVEDTGIGIPEPQQHRLFERFSQVDTSVARRFGGSGLGLAICKKLVGLMGGEIGVVSREGAGSTFWFTVTLPRAGLPAAAPPRTDPPLRRRARILVAEDLEINRRLVAALLEAAGHEAHIVADGADAVAAVAAGPFDLVLMDIRMPGMDGITAARLIRQSGGPEARIPIVAMTANVYPEQIAMSRGVGMNAHVGKPLNRAQLYATIDALIGGGTGDGTLPGAGAAEPASTDDEASPFDAATYAQLLAFLGTARLDDVLSRFAASLPQSFEPGDATEERERRWKADAHVVVSVAGMLGFGELAHRCRAFEIALPGSGLHAARLAAVRAGRDAVLPRLAELRRDLAASAERDSTAA